MRSIDHDLLSVQEARVKIEQAEKAQKQMRAFSQEQLDAIVAAMLSEIRQHTEALARLSCHETGFGNWQDKTLKNNILCQLLEEAMQGQRYVGVIHEDPEKKLFDVGVPYGVVVSLMSATNPTSTVIHNALIAIKSGNAIVFSPHPWARKTVSRVLDILIQAAEEEGLPRGAMSYLSDPAESGAQELISHEKTKLVLLTGVPEYLEFTKATAKPFIEGGPGNGPVFIERTANLSKAVTDIIFSRTFDHGVVSAGEQSVVVDGCVAEQVRADFIKHGAHFLTEEQSDALEKKFHFKDGRENSDLIGKTAIQVAEIAGITVPESTKLLISEKKYIATTNPYSKERLFPVVAFYIEEDWMEACEKCIELLVEHGKGHTLVIHSTDEAVIREFALKKPVARVLVNTPATFGSMGATTNLYPSMTLGNAGKSGGIAIDNLSPANLITIRRVGYEARQIQDLNIYRRTKTGVLPREDTETTQPLAQMLEWVLEKLAEDQS